MFKSIRAKSALIFGIFLASTVLGSSNSSFNKEGTDPYGLFSSNIEKKIQDPAYLKKIIHAFFGKNSHTAHNYQALFLYIKHSEQSRVLVNGIFFHKNKSLLISNTVFQKAAIHYFLTSKDYKPYGWQSLADTTLITQPEVRKTILNEIQKVLQRPAARLPQQFIDSLKHVIKVVKNNYDIALLNEIKEIVATYGKAADKQQLLDYLQTYDKPTKRTYFDECTLIIDQDADYAEATLDIRQNVSTLDIRPYDVATMSAAELTERLNNPLERSRIIDNLFNSPYVNALDLIHDKKIAFVKKIKINNTYVEPNQTFWLSSQDVLTNRLLLFNNQQVIEALAYRCVQAFVHDNEDAQLIISMCRDKELKTAPLFKELVINGIVQNLPHMQKTSFKTVSVLCHLIVDLIRCKNEELLNTLIQALKQNQHKSDKYLKLIQMVENDRTQIESQILKEDRFFEDLESDFTE